MGGNGKARLSGFSLSLSAITALQVLASFGLQSYVVAHFGISASADAFYAGGTLTQIVSVLLVDSLPLVLVPLLSNTILDRFQEELWQILIVFVLLLGILAIVLASSAGVLIPILVPGFSADNKALTTQLTRIQLIGLAGAGVTAVLTSAWQARRHFLQPALAVLSSTVAGCGVMVYALRAGAGIEMAAWAQVIAAAGPGLLLTPILAWPAGPVWSWNQTVELWRRLRPLIAGKACFVASAPIDRLLVSFLPPGTMVMFELVSRFYTAVQRILAQGVLTPMLPDLSQLAKQARWTDFRMLCRKQNRTILLLSVIVVAGTELAALTLLPFAKDLPGAFWHQDTSRLTAMLALLGGSLPFICLAAALTNAFYAQGDTATPARIAVFAYAAGIPLRLAGFYAAGITGICIAVTLWTIFQCVLLQRALTRCAVTQVTTVAKPAALAAAQGS